MRQQFQKKGDSYDRPLGGLQMSRSNNYRICERCTADQACWLHERGGFNYQHKPEREILARRTWKRKGLYRLGPKRYHNGPPRWWWQEKHAKARAIYRQIMHREEDPVLPRERDLIDLWDWY